jgi:hypothetical protein
MAEIVGDAKKDTAETHARSIEMAAATHAKGQQDAASILAKAQLEVASMRFDSQKLANAVAQERLQHDIAVSARELKLKELQIEFEQVLKLAAGFADVPFDEAVKRATKLLHDMKACT